MQQSAEATIEMVAQPPPAPAPAEQPSLPLIAQVELEISNLREQRHQLAAQSQEYHTELITISQRLREAGVGLDEVERLQGRRAAITQANATLGAEDERLERALNEATDRLAALKQEREYCEGLRNNLRAQILTQCQRERDAMQEAQLATQLVRQAEAQLQGVIARLNELGEAPASPRFRVTQ